MSKLWKVCDVVRKELGLDNISFQYDAHGEDKKLDEKNVSLGSTFILPQGSAGLIDFWALFFIVPSNIQLSTIVHEHLHVRLMPYHQVAGQITNGQLDRDRFVSTEEHIIDQLATPLARLIRPKLKGVWDMRSRLTIPSDKRYCP